jgi:hypothetical protein
MRVNHKIKHAFYNFAEVKDVLYFPGVIQK